MYLKTNKQITLTLYAALALLLTACRNSRAPEQTANQPVLTTVPDSVPAPDSIPVQDKAALILNTSTYHGDEVPKDAARRKWMGLFRNAGTYYLDTVRIRVKTVFDAVLDEDENGEHTGIDISTAHKDTAILLFSGISGLRPGKVNSLAAINAQEYPFFTLQPGDSFHFEYAGASYTLLAKGKKAPVEEQAGAYTISDYRLYLSGIKEGQPVQQLLTAQPGFDDAEIGIMFCGDIDGDRIPDFIINTSNHYNVFQPTLYLSTGAGPGRWLRLVARHTSVGC